MLIQPGAAMQDFKTLETFVAVATLGGFRAAAERLNTTQPAVSQRIAQLEHHYGARLLERTSRVVTTTDKGREFLAYAERILRLGAEMRSALSEPGAMRGTLRLGVAETIVHSWLPGFIGHVARQHPAIAVEIEVDTSPLLRGRLIAKEIDLAFLLGPLTDPLVRNLPLNRVPLAFLASPDFALPNLPLSVAALAQLPLITFARHTQPPRRWRRSMRPRPSSVDRSSLLIDHHRIARLDSRHPAWSHAGTQSGDNAARGDHRDDDGKASGPAGLARHLHGGRMSDASRLLPDEPLPQRISRILAWLAGAIVLFGCSFLITVDVVTRFFFKRGMVESFEISGYALAACIGLGLAFTVTSKANIRVDILLDALPDRMRVVCDLIASLALALIALTLAWFAWGTLAQSWALGAKSISLLQVPMVIPQGIWFTGIFWFACMAVLIPIQAVMRLFAHDRIGFDALIGSLRVTEEIEQSGVEQPVAGRGEP